MSGTVEATVEDMSARLTSEEHKEEALELLGKSTALLATTRTAVEEFYFDLMMSGNYRGALAAAEVKEAIASLIARYECLLRHV